MHLLVVCTHNEGCYDALTMSAQRCDYHMFTLGWKQKWRGFVWRLTLILDALSVMRDEEVVCITDAYDVIMLIPAMELEARYRALVGDEGKVLLSVENPLDHSMAGTIGLLMYGRCINNKTVSAGAYMGTVAKLRVFLMFIQEVAVTNKYTDDQKVLNRNCDVLHDANIITVDLQGDIFFHATCQNGVNGFMSGDCLFGLNNNLENPRTGRRPAILHAPGGLNLDPICQQLQLPPTRIRNRWRWFAHNYCKDWIVFGTIVLLIMTAIIMITHMSQKSHTH
jgi:hypothetical protein